MDIKEVIKQYKSGKTLQAIADIYGVSKQRIDQILRSNKIERRPRKSITPEKEARIKQLATEGKTDKEITQIVGVSWQIISGIRKQYGIPRAKREYRCTKCGGTIWRANGKGKVCVPCSAKRAREYYQTHGKITRAAKRKAK